jgi:hypothetical protein
MKSLRIPLLLVLSAMAATSSAQVSENPVPITDPALLARLAGAVPPGTRMLMWPGALSSTRAVVPDDAALARYQWGTADFSSTSYSGEAFEPFDGATATRGPGYLTFTGAGFQSAAVAIQVDTGVSVDGVMWWAFDEHPTDDMTLYVFSLCWPFGPGSYTLTLHATGSTTGDSGFQHLFTGIGPPVTIQNGLCNYYIQLTVPTGTLMLRFERARVGWFRQVSPAPATATFTDVPTGHPFFQFVEALARSGITAGCGGGNFCPDAPLTRGQMAVFLSVALGLHFPF